MASNGESTGIKRRRIVRRKRKAGKHPDGLTQPELPFEGDPKPRGPKKIKSKKGKRKIPKKSSNQLGAALDNLMLRGRSYKLTFGMPGNRKTLSEVERVQSLKSENDAISLAKSLYDEHDPHLKSLRAAKDTLRKYFESVTIAHPEPAVRLFVARTPSRPWSEMSHEEVEEEMARQLNAFHHDMMERIDLYREGPVQAVIDNYEEILERARVKLGSLYDPTQYPLKSDLRQLIYVRFLPVPSVLPPEYNRIDPEMRNRVSMYVREQLESSLAIQLETIEQSLNESLAGLADRIKGIDSGDKSRFYDSRVTHVAEAISDYETTVRSLGIELGTDLGDNLKKLRESLKRAGDDPRKMINTLRSSDTTRQEVLTNLNRAISSTTNAFKPLVRRVDVD